MVVTYILITVFSKDVDECTMDLCKGAKCTNSMGSYECQCPKGSIFDAKTGCKSLKNLNLYFFVTYKLLFVCRRFQRAKLKRNLRAEKLKSSV